MITLAVQQLAKGQANLKNCPKNTEFNATMTNGTSTYVLKLLVVCRTKNTTSIFVCFPVVVSGDIFYQIRPKKDKQVCFSRNFVSSNLKHRNMNCKYM